MDKFLREPEFYTRDLDILRQYTQDAATYLHKRTGKDMDICTAFVEKKLTDDNASFTDSPTLMLVKETHGNREQAVVPFLSYLKDVEEKGNIISPTMAVYTNQNEKMSLLSEYISENIAKRKKSKKEKFAAQVAGDKAMETFKDNEQASFKIKNNSLSGAHASPYTILYNKSTHSTLTSTCRSATSYGNANNEKFLCGNRHYWSPDIVLSNIVSIINVTDLMEVQATMDAFDIRPPTVEETLDCINYSADLYWRNTQAKLEIESLVKSLSDVERSAVVYVGDLYHLAKYNDHVVRTFLDRMSEPAKEPIDNPDHWVDLMDDDLSALVKYLCIDEIDKRSMGDVKTNDPRAYGIVGATAKQILSVVDEYAQLIRGLWTTPNLPASVANLPSIIRRGAVASDTDSTIFTVQFWTEWFTGNKEFSKKSNAVRDVMSYLSSKSIMHILAMMSTQMGVTARNRHKISMKNEYTFPVFALTSRSKHYFAYMSAQEGNVFKDLKLELKGVALRNSNSPAHIREKSKEFIETTMQKIIAGEKLNAANTLKYIGDIEREIIDTIKSGSPAYFKTGQVKSADSYKNPEISPYKQYLLWEEVFASKYGHAEAPPYQSVKVSIDAHNGTLLKNWLDNLEDQAIADTMRGWLKANSRNYLTTLVLPMAIAKSKGIPSEIISGVNIRKIVVDVMEPFYLVLESLGLYMKDDNNTRLVSDYH